MSSYSHPEARYAPEDGYYEDTYGYVATKEDLVERTVQYLFVDVDGKDECRFYEGFVDFDIYEKCKEIDSMLM